MKILILFSLLSLSSFAQVSIVSDLDDTIKITNVGSPIEASYSGLFKDRIFTGMAPFFNQARTYSNSLHVVSAGPKFLHGKVSSTLNKHQIKFESINLRDVMRESKMDFKYNVIKRVLESSSDNLLLIGDDVDLDPEIYQRVGQDFPGRIEAIYIHVVNGRAKPEGSISYFTSFDLALWEGLAGRMNMNGVSEILKSVASEKQMKNIFPDFAVCPEIAVFEWQLRTVFMPEALSLSQKIESFCKRI